MRDPDTDRVLPLSTFVLALSLSVVPLPGVVATFRPDWVPLIMIYWVVMTPERFGLFTAMWLGLAADTLSGSLLGQHALAMLVVGYLCLRFHLRIRVFPVWQMCMSVLFMLAIYEFVLFWIDGVAGRTVPYVERWAPVITGVLLWPLILGILDRIRQDNKARV
ncbi:MAG: rod shape-determining protein MreD [Pseudomonadota bacterium]|mgnify:FL=1|jgi:rod shape-determining protein MreD|nr:rod shape-determining protein MreD [Pseudomonadota bacterium]